jgi:hypothetical protein
VTYTLATEHYRTWFSPERFRLERGAVPEFRVWHPAVDFYEAYWLLTVRLGDVLDVKLSGVGNLFQD